MTTNVNACDCLLFHLIVIVIIISSLQSSLTSSSSSSSSSFCRVPSSRQLRWLKRIKRHMALPRGREVWLWFDVVSIPQRSRDLQIKAIASLPAYTQLCTRYTR